MGPGGSGPLLPLVVLFSFCISNVYSYGLVEDIYCGLENCYDVLSVNREEFDKVALPRIYRQLIRTLHPDKLKHKKMSEEERDAAGKRFLVVAAAYETLKDEQSRTDYDYYLDHPEERYYNYYAYYRRRLAPKVDVRLVILGTILSISLFQYYSAKQKYSEAIAYAMTVGKFRNLAINTGVERKLLEVDKAGKLKKLKGVNNEAVIKEIIEENMDIRGGYKKESIYDTLMWYCICLPYSLVIYVVWYAKWVYKYWILREELDDEAKHYLIRKNLKLGETQYQCMEEAEHEDMMAAELWKTENFVAWKANKEKEEQEKLASSGKYKRYKRYMKNNTGTMSFLDED